MALGGSGDNVDELLERLEELAGLGVTSGHGWVPGVSSIDPLDILGARVIPVIAQW